MRCGKHASENTPTISADVHYLRASHSCADDTSRRTPTESPRASSELLDPRFGFDHRRLHAALDFEAAGFDGVAVGVGGTATASGTTQAAALNGRGTQNRSQLLARHGFLNAMPAPTIGRPVRLPR